MIDRGRRLSAWVRAGGLRDWLMEHRRQWGTLLLVMFVAGCWYWWQSEASRPAAWFAFLRAFWYLPPVFWFLVVVTAFGVVVVCAQEWEDWRRRSRRKSWRWLSLAPVDVLASAVALVWDGLSLPWRGYWLGCVPQFVETCGYAVFEAVVAVLTNGMSRIYGTYVICGLPGVGKTQAAAQLLMEYRKRWGDRVYIGTNLPAGWRGDETRGIRGEDVRITGWAQCVELPLEVGKPCIWMLDEGQNSFGSRQFKDFPRSLEFLTTQSRKFGGGTMLIITCQDFLDLDPKLRRLAQRVYDARSFVRGRWVHLTGYEGETGYRDGMDPLIGPQRKVVARKAFMARPSLRHSYNSFDLALLVNGVSEEPEDPVEQIRRMLDRERAEQRRAGEAVAALAAGVSRNGRHR